jgi:hypothetical protein
MRMTTPEDNPAATLLTAIVSMSHRDIATVSRRGERATTAQVLALEEAQSFLDWCRNEFADALAEQTRR